MSESETVDSVIISDHDRDALHVLPLAIVPFVTPKLQHAKMLKNARLETVVQLFEGHGSGSGQIDPGLIHHEFSWEKGTEERDYLTVQKLARLSSYDVYSLRILLRQNGIEVESADSLKLSDDKQTELNSYMVDFTRPLIADLFGSAQDFQSFGEIIEELSKLDSEVVKTNLTALSEKLGMQIHDLPSFLETYGDVYLSLSYFRQVFDRLVPKMDNFIESSSEICGHYQLRSNRNLIDTCRKIASTMSEKMNLVVGFIENFTNSPEMEWHRLNKDKFQSFAKNVILYHTTIGGLLCMLSVKMQSWHDQFPDLGSGGPNRRAEFIMSDMRPGIDQIAEFEAKLPSVGR